MKILLFLLHVHHGARQFSLNFILLLLLALSSLGLSQTNDQGKRLEFQAENKDGSSDILEFNNIVIEPKSNGNVYIGARNRLYQLDNNLRKTIRPIVTGPVKNNIVCECTRDGLTDNVNKLLLIDSTNNRIINCGSVEQGLCEVRQEDNIDNLLSNSNISFTKSRHHVAAGGYLSTVGFIAMVSSGEKFLYVGSSKTVQDEQQLKDIMESSFYTVAKRYFPADSSDPEIFSVDLGGIKTGGLPNEIGLKMVEKDYAEQGFRVNFVDGFATNLTGYFITTHPSPSQSPPYNEMPDITYLSQLCLEDVQSDMPSYMEISLECNRNGIPYNRAVASRTAKAGNLLKETLGLDIASSGEKPSEMVFISFVRSTGRFAGSAVCVFPLWEIEEKFVQLTGRCQLKSLQSQPDHISWAVSAVNARCGFSFDITSPVCKKKDMWDVVQHLEGNLFSKDAIFTSDIEVTAIEITRSEDMDHTVALFGTKNGQLLKVALDSDELNSPLNVLYETITIAEPANQYFNQLDEKNPAVVKTIRLDYNDNTEPRRIYAMTPGIVVGLPLFNCSQYVECEACLGSGDPFCGWCTLEGRCTSPGQCKVFSSTNNHQFIKRGNCPRLTSDEPLVLEASQSQRGITLIGHNVPLDMQQRSYYHCYFGNLYHHPVTHVGSGDPVTMRCVSPPLSSIPKFSPGQGSIVLPLSLVYTGSGVTTEIAKTNFTFYKCSVYTRCVSCVGTAFNCSWCFFDNTCTHQSNTYCPEFKIELTKNCPQITSLGGDNTLYLPESIGRDLTLPAKNLPLEYDSFRCELSIQNGGNAQASSAARGDGGNSIQCINVIGSLPVNFRSAKASLRVTTNSPELPRIEIDNPTGLSVEIYHCDVGSDGSCGSCVQSPARWQCGWCETSSRCTLESDCGDWLEASQNKPCKMPKITKFIPQSAPFGGDSTTILRLEGVNFALNGRMSILVAGLRCVVMNSTCCEAKCTPKAGSIVSGPIELCTDAIDDTCMDRDNYATTTSTSFEFVDPLVYSFRPSSGLAGWGTLITVEGKYLDTGNSRKIIVAGKACEVEHVTSNQLRCRLECSSRSVERRRRDLVTSVLEKISRPRRSPATRMLQATFDGVQRVSKEGKFRFVDDVSITSVQPIITIRSGGLPLNVTGTNLDLIQNPRIRVVLKSKEEFLEKCEKGEGNQLICIAPDISSSSIFKNSGSERTAEAFVKIESAECQRQWVANEVRLVYDANPRLDMFEGDESKIYRNESIYITGERLCPTSNDNNCVISTVKVLIGGDMDCEVTRLDTDQITCVPPKASLGSYDVKVEIGFFSQTIGKLEYTKQEEFPTTAVITVIVILALLAMAIFVAVCFYCRRAKATDQQLKDVQMQMVQLESKVANVCKEAFAELQTDMSQLDTCGTAGIPYLHYRTYLMRVLFPDPITHDKLHNVLLSYNLERNDSRNSNRGMLSRNPLPFDRFNQLLENKIFLLSFIKAVERQRTFSMKDRSQVAGLILIILHGRLQYATEILEDLLAELIRKNLTETSHPKLLLRRSESVAEKMLTHWFSILLHKFVVECAGEPLFTLYRAIKQQVNKGPLDAFTSEARYSLSEDKLLRQDVEAESITLRVTNYLGDNDQPIFSVKVLTCDAISQAKRKILDVCYMNVHYSMRPHPDQIDLELNKNGKFIMRDDDSTSSVEGEWKQINTLSHYLVCNNNRVALIPRQEQSQLDFSVLSSVSKTGKHNGSSLTKFQSNADSHSSLPRLKQQQTSGTGSLALQDTTKSWHLVKQSDQDTKEDHGNKLISEIYLTRLLTTKGTIQKYVDDLFETIFSVLQRGHTLPLAVKHMFDFLDHQADINGIVDRDIVHTWKSNCLPLRFWVNLIKNPEFVFDIHKSPIVDCYLSVIAGAFMDSCSTAEFKLGKDSPSNKLLYAKDIPEYREWVSRYYSDIADMDRLNPRDLNAFLQEESSQHAVDFNTHGALNQLYSYVQKYSDEIINILDSNPEARRQRLTKQFHEVCMSMNNGAAAV